MYNPDKRKHTQLFPSCAGPAGLFHCFWWSCCRICADTVGMSSMISWSSLNYRMSMCECEVAALSLWVKLLVPTQLSHLPQRIARISSQGNAAPQWRLSYQTNTGLYNEWCSATCRPAFSSSVWLFFLRVNVPSHVYSWGMFLLTPVIFTLFYWLKWDLIVIWHIICVFKELKKIFFIL